MDHDTPPESPTSDSETSSLPSTINIDLPYRISPPTEDDIKALHPQHTLSFRGVHSITMMEVIGPSPNTKVDREMRPFAVRAQANPDLWRDFSLEIMVCVHDANTAKHVTDDVLAGYNTITGVRSEDLNKHGETVLIFDFPIRGLQISREGRFFFAYAFVDPLDTTRALPRCFVDGESHGGGGEPAGRHHLRIDHSTWIDR